MGILMAYSEEAYREIRATMAHSSEEKGPAFLSSG